MELSSQSSTALIKTTSTQAPAVHHATDATKRLEILTGAARYDVSCASSGSSVQRKNAKVGNVSNGGICHSWSADGRCISLLKVLFSNACQYDCAYCVNRCSNDVERATFEVREIVDLTMHFYRRNYIEGLFLSSGVWRSPNTTMECLVRVIEELRYTHGFGGYIHIKAIPGADPSLLWRAGLAADRISVNIELPSEKSLVDLAPQKSRNAILRPMRSITNFIAESKVERKRHRSAPAFSPAGQSTQLMIGASPESDAQILRLSEGMYRKFGLKRVYYSAFVPVNTDKRLPTTAFPPMKREHRLYQADWLLRFYGYETSELFGDSEENLDTDLDPKAHWALQHPEWFPVEINKASREMLLRVPGIGPKSARRIVANRRYSVLRLEDLKKIGVVTKRARHFITCNGRYGGERGWSLSRVRATLVSKNDYAGAVDGMEQLELFG